MTHYYTRNSISSATSSSPSSTAAKRTANGAATIHRAARCAPASLCVDRARQAWRLFIYLPQVYGREIQQDVDLVDEFCFQCRAAQAKAAGIPLR